MVANNLESQLLIASRKYKHGVMVGEGKLLKLKCLFMPMC